VAVIGRHAYRVPESAGWHHIAGLTVGQGRATGRCRGGLGGGAGTRRGRLLDAAVHRAKPARPAVPPTSINPKFQLAAEWQWRDLLTQAGRGRRPRIRRLHCANARGRSWIRRRRRDGRHQLGIGDQRHRNPQTRDTTTPPTSRACRTAPTRRSACGRRTAWTAPSSPPSTDSPPDHPAGRKTSFGSWPLFGARSAKQAVRCGPALR
jgi:hypothetical protein